MWSFFHREVLNMMLVVEPSIHGTGHSNINTGILRALREAFPAQPLHFAAEAEQRLHRPSAPPRP